MTDDTPKIASTLESTRLFAAGVAFLEACFIWQHKRGLAIAFVLAGLTISLHAIRILSTELTREGISQMTWRGRRHLAWKDVAEVTRRPRSITVSGAGLRFDIPIDSFYDTATAVRFINSHLPLRLAGDLQAHA